MREEGKRPEEEEEEGSRMIYMYQSIVGAWYRHLSGCTECQERKCARPSEREEKGHQQTWRIEQDVHLH